ncbi:MAG: FadR family transcriptional regulator [Deferribacteres bacterium]|nr:FadR family transcriptional regulator [Deferribacteres bacterium]
MNISPNLNGRETLGKKIEKKLTTAITQKKFSVGEKLPTEKELCEQFGVSRTVIREALQALSAKGLITVKRGSGAYVSDYTFKMAREPMHLYIEQNFDKNHILSLLEIRKIVEPELARLAAQNRTAKDLVVLEESLQRFKDRSLDAPIIALADVEFHECIARASGNPLVPLMLDPIHSLMLKIKTLMVRMVNQELALSDTAVNFHERIYDSINRMDGDAAFTIMKEHLEQASKDALQLFAFLDKVER